MILTDKVFGGSAGLSREAVVDAVKTGLSMSELIGVPREPYDPIGHSDGMICWLGENLMLVNDCSAFGEPFRWRIHQNLRRDRLAILVLPYRPRSGGRRRIPTAATNSMNFLWIRDLLIAPAFGLNGDDRALAILSDLHQEHPIEALACRDLAEEGGLLHCVTWQARLPGRLRRPCRSQPDLEKTSKTWELHACSRRLNLFLSKSLRNRLPSMVAIWLQARGRSRVGL